jgi:hypothetical protein
MKKFAVKPRITHARHLLVGGNDEDQSVFLGRLAEAGQLVRIDFEVSHPHVIAIFGKRGSGKSFTLGSLVEGLCTKAIQTSISRIRKRQAILLFDTLGIFQWMEVRLSPDSPQKLVQEQALLQKGWDIASEELNIEVFAPRGTTAQLGHCKEFTINCSDFSASDWGYLFGVDILQDRMGQLLNDAYEKVVNEGWSDGAARHRPQPSYAIEDLMDCVLRDTELGANYHSETRRAVLQQLSVYWRNPLFQPKRRPPAALKWLIESGEASEDDLKAYQSAEGTDLRSILRSGQLAVLLLHKISDELRLVLIVSLMRKIMQARIETSELEKSLRILPNLGASEIEAIQLKILRGIPPSWIIADEAQNFLPSERKTSATDVLTRFVREGRNFGLSFVMTTQQPSAIDQRILAQVDTLIAHKLTVQSDIEYIKRNLKSTLPLEIKYGNDDLSFDDLMRTLDVGQAIVSNTEADRTFIIEVRPRISVHGGFGS